MNGIPHALQSAHAFVAGHGGMLLAGTTALLCAGWVALRLQRSPVHRQRLGEFTAGCTLLWLALACVPIPRLASAPPEAPARRQPPGPAEPARPLRLPATAPVDGVYVASYESVDAAEVRALLPALAHRPAGGSSNPAPLPHAPAAAVDRSGPGLTVRGALAIAYLGGVLVCAGWLLLAHVLLARMLRDATRAAPWLRDLFESLHRQTSAGRAPRLLVSDRCGRPVSCGVLRPTVLLPAECARADAQSQLRHVLLHELVHVCQRDALGNALFNLAMPLLYFHPLYWLVRADVHLARELVADDCAAGRTVKASYVADLIALAKEITPPGAGSAGRSAAGRRSAAVGLFLFGTGSPTNFYRRMHMLMHRRETESLATRCSAAWRLAATGCCGLVLAVAVALAGVRPARAQEGPALKAEDARRAAEREALEATLAAREQDLQRAREQLDKAAYDTQRTDAEHARRAVEVKAAKASLEAMKQQLSNVRSATKDDGRSDAIEKDPAMRQSALKKREAEIAAAQAKLQAADLDLAKRQQAASFEQQQLAQRLATEQGARADLKKSPEDRDDSIGGSKGEVTDDQSRDPNPKLSKAKEKARKDDKAKSVEGPFAKAGGGDAGDMRFESRGSDDAPAAGLKIDAGSLDLIGLATSYADAVGDVRMAEARVAIAHESDRAGDEKLELAGLEKSRHKARLLRSIAEVALRGAAEEYERTQQLFNQKVASRSEVSEARSKIEILKLILDAGDSAGTAAPRKF